ncbi:MAG: hypothetical protein M1524_00520 [Patescibacteria group bacterium]|nr:hypothetical protein [Patescibacteria group bacterium]
MNRCEAIIGTPIKRVFKALGHRKGREIDPLDLSLSEESVKSLSHSDQIAHGIAVDCVKRGVNPNKHRNEINAFAMEIESTTWLS